MNKFCMHPSCLLRPQSSCSAPRIMTSGPIQFYLSFFSLSMIIKCTCRCWLNTARQRIWEQEKWANHKGCWSVFVSLAVEKVTLVGCDWWFLQYFYIFFVVWCLSRWIQVAHCWFVLINSTFLEGSKPVINRMFIQTATKSTLRQTLFSSEAIVILCLDSSSLKLKRIKILKFQKGIKSTNQVNHLVEFENRHCCIGDILRQRILMLCYDRCYVMCSSTKVR